MQFLSNWFVGAVFESRDVDAVLARALWAMLADVIGELSAWAIAVRAPTSRALSVRYRWRHLAYTYLDRNS